MEPLDLLKSLSSKEPAYIRYFDAHNPTDIEIYKQIDEDPEVDKWMHEPHINTVDAIKEHFADLDDHLLFAICDKETDAVVGWLQFAVEENYHVDQFDAEVKKLLTGKSIYYEVSFARLNANKERLKRGLISSAVRQGCLFLLNQYTKFSNNVECSITAYTNQQNIASARVLEKSFFRKAGAVYYDEKDISQKDTLWILNNNVLEALFYTEAALLDTLDPSAKEFFELNTDFC